LNGSAIAIVRKILIDFDRLPIYAEFRRLDIGGRAADLWLT